MMERAVGELRLYLSFIWIYEAKFRTEETGSKQYGTGNTRIY